MYLNSFGTDFEIKIIFSFKFNWKIDLTRLGGPILFYSKFAKFLAVLYYRKKNKTFFFPLKSDIKI